MNRPTTPGCTPRWGPPPRRRSPCAGMDLADDIMGDDLVPGPGVPHGRRPASRPSANRRCSTRCSSRSPTTASRPTVLAARLTYLGAPEALQGAVAAGMLGGGSVFLGVAEDAARFLDEIARGRSRAIPTTPTLRTAASGAVAAVAPTRAADARARASGAQGDRSPRPAHVRARHGARPARAASPRCCRSSPRSRTSRRGRQLPINGAGVAGAALADLGFDWRIIRGLRAAGPHRGAARPPRRGDAHARWRCRSGRWWRPEPPSDVIPWPKRSAARSTGVLDDGRAATEPSLARHQPPRARVLGHGRHRAVLRRGARRPARRDRRHPGLPALLLRDRRREHPRLLRVLRTSRSSTSPSRPASRATAATQFDHLSFDLVDEEALLDMRSRLKAAGCEVTDVVDHGFIRSIYFNDPNGIALEASYWVVDPTGWAEVSLEDERLFGDREPRRGGRRDPQHRTRRARAADPPRRLVHQRHRGLGRQGRPT